MKTLKIPDETLDFLAWLVRQDVTLTAVLSDYLEWNRYTKQEIRNHLHALNEACVEARN